MIRLREAKETDNEKLIALLGATPNAGIVSLNFERKPNFFYGSSVSAQQPRICVAEDEDNGDIVGVYGNGAREVFVNGVKKNVRYLNELRIAEKHRKGRLLLRIIKDFHVVQEEGEYAQTSILEGNSLSLPLISKGRKGLGTYYPYSTLTTYIMSTTFDFAPKSSLVVRKAQQEDIPKMQLLFDQGAAKKQFYPVYDFSRIGKDDYYRDLTIEDYFLAFENENLVGIMGTWNQEGFKQTRMVDYTTWINFARPLYNLWTKYFGGFPLPQKMDIAHYVMMHCIISQNNNPKPISALLHHIRKELSGRGDKTMNFGITEHDSLNAAVKGFVYRKIKSLHYLVTLGDDMRDDLDDSLPLYLEVARL